MGNTKVIIFHSPLAKDAPADELDVLDQAGFFTKGLVELGYDPHTLPFPYNLTELETTLKTLNPILIVNLVETIFADGKLVHIGPFLFEHFNYPYTGCSAQALYLTSKKILSKQQLTLHGIATPRWYNHQMLLEEKPHAIDQPYLVKSLWEHASYGLDEAKPLLFSSRNELLERMGQEKNPEDFFCEQYIHGREFNLSVINGRLGPEVLPAAEIRFEYPPDKPRILGYKAKWEEESFEYKHTVRSFEFPESDQQLLEKLKHVSLQCWKIFGLKGYARVDFRVDDNGDLFVLEINANPCISPDSGFVAACQRAGLSEKDVVRRIIGL
jgi:D-alanine-D-alanine ligase